MRQRIPRFTQTWGQEEGDCDTDKPGEEGRTVMASFECEEASEENLDGVAPQETEEYHRDKEQEGGTITDTQSQVLQCAKEK